MKKKVAILSVLLTMLVSTTVFARSGYMNQNMTINDARTVSSSIGKNISGTARVDVNTISTTGTCKNVKVFIMNIDSGEFTQPQYFQAQNTRMYNISPGNIKAVFQKSCSDGARMNVNYNFIYDL